MIGYLTIQITVIFRTENIFIKHKTKPNQQIMELSLPTEVLEYLFSYLPTKGKKIKNKNLTLAT